MIDQEKKKLLSLLPSLIDSTFLQDEEVLLQKFITEHKDCFERNSDKKPASICSYPRFLPILQNEFHNYSLVYTSVTPSFPSHDDNHHALIRWGEHTRDTGVSELDIVLNPSFIYDQNKRNTFKELCKELKKIFPCLKVIIETGVLQSAERIISACTLCLEANVNFIKTSTGKNGPGASLEHTKIILEQINLFYGNHSLPQTGIKVSGGVRTVQDAFSFLKQFQAINNKCELTKESFRIGSSSLFTESLR